MRLARRAGRAVIALTALTLMCGCAERTSPPDPPGSLTLPAEYAWGDAVASRDERLARHITGRLGERFGQARETHYVASDIAAVRALDGWYRDRLGEDWRPAPLDGVFGPGEAGFGFARGDDALVVAWLGAQADGRVPVTVFRFGE